MLTVRVVTLVSSRLVTVWGDNAEMCFIELVDYNENMAKEKVAKKATRTRRSKKSAAAEAAPAAETAPVAEAPAAEEAKAE